MIIDKVYEFAVIGGWIATRIDDGNVLISRQGSAFIVSENESGISHCTLNSIDQEDLAEALLVTNRFKFYAPGTVYTGYLTGDYLGRQNTPRAFLYRDSISLVDNLLCHNYYEFGEDNGESWT